MHRGSGPSAGYGVIDHTREALDQVERRQPFSESTSLNGLIYNSKDWIRSPSIAASMVESNSQLLAVIEEARKTKAGDKGE